MYINKIGAQHLETGMNCQDYGFENGRMKVVCDGCSEGNHTEVGAKAYCYLASLGYGIHQIFKKLIDMFGQSTSSIKNFLCFTILSEVETETEFKISYCGDGYIILQDITGRITFEELTDGEYPKYFSYNYCDPDSLKYYKEGVEMNEKIYKKSEYLNVGIASDGLRFIVNADEGLKNEFIDLLNGENTVKIKRFINRNQKIFKDDITIVF